MVEDQEMDLPIMPVHELKVPVAHDLTAATETPLVSVDPAPVSWGSGRSCRGMNIVRRREKLCNEGCR